MKKKIGIAVDKYKVPAYTRVLTQNGYDVKVTEGTIFWSITFEVDEVDFLFATLEVNEICKQLEHDFKARKN